MRLMIAAALLIGASLVSACSNSTEAASPERLAAQYGVTGAYTTTITTADGAIKGTVVPVTLADGRTAQLVIPLDRRNEPHTLYLHEEDGFHPVQVQENVTRTQLVQSPSVVGQRAEAPHPRKRSWEKDALIIGGSAGGGALIGAAAGGKKGAAVGAAAGGIGGLIYDLTKRH